MKFIAEIDIMPLKALLDPQGKAVKQTLHGQNFKQVTNVRIGKHISMELDAENKKEAEKITMEICNNILHNPVMETYTFTVNELK